MTLEDVARVAAELPEAVEGERQEARAWSVAGKVFAWERRFSKADLRRLGDETPPPEPILAVRVADLVEKEAVLAANPGSFFTIPHSEGFPAVLVRLDTARLPRLRDALVDGWLALAPRRLADEYARAKVGSATSPPGAPGQPEARRT